MTACPLCVQWRCIECKSHDWPACCEDWSWGAEPYWPDGTVATVTQEDPCARCAEAVAQHEADHKDDPT